MIDKENAEIAAFHCFRWSQYASICKKKKKLSQYLNCVAIIQRCIQLMLYVNLGLMIFFLDFYNRVNVIHCY